MIIDLTEDEEVVPSSEEQPTAAPGASYASSMSSALPLSSNADAPRNFPTFSKPNSYIPAWSGMNPSYHKQTLQSYRNVIASNVTEGGNIAAYSRNATLAAPQSAISNQIPISGLFPNNPLHVSQQHYPMTIEKKRVYPPALNQSKPVSAYEANMASRATATNTVTNRIAVSGIPICKIPLGMRLIECRCFFSPFFFSFFFSGPSDSAIFCSRSSIFHRESGIWSSNCPYCGMPKANPWCKI